MAFGVASILILAFLSLHGGSCKSPHQAILGKEMVTQLHFYFHDVISGDNPTAVEVVHANSTSPTLFGSITIFDDLLTKGPEPTSKVVGNAQGPYIATDKERFSLLFHADFEFTTGKFEGSSISIFFPGTLHPKNAVSLLCLEGEGSSGSHGVSLSLGRTILTSLRVMR